MAHIKLDPDVKGMDASPEAKQTIMRLRRGIRKHRDKDENARCWHADLELYALLPEEKPAGRMDQPKETLLGNCERYIDRQKCGGCPIADRLGLT